VRTFRVHFSRPGNCPTQSRRGAPKAAEGRSGQTGFVASTSLSRAPLPLDAGVSARMSRMPRSDTKPELALRRELHARGLRFRLHAPLPGRPDVALTRVRLAVFVDGCFWHVCPEHATAPKNNRDWWRAKLDANVARDRRNDAALETLGWLAVHVWEHEDVGEAGERIVRLWQSRLEGQRA
jgi:DNA mismatch endonuclease (patch repair protein)